MKLTKSKVIETFRKLNEGKTVYQARKVAEVSVRRVYQLKEAFDKTGEIPQIGKDVGRPRKPFEEQKILLVKKAFEKYRVPADTLERLIDRDYKIHVGHNRIHKILIHLGFAKHKLKKDIRKKVRKLYNMPVNRRGYRHRSRGESLFGSLTNEFGDRFHVRNAQTMRARILGRIISYQIKLLIRCNEKIISFELIIRHAPDVYL